MTRNKILKQYFGYDEFREGQAEIIDTILSGGDALGVMPTGAGKSLCYQVPAMLLPGVTLVISPLISLMRDQVQALNANGIPAAFINSSLSEAQRSRAMQNARNGQYKIIYIAPERLLSPSMLELAGKLEISLVAVDEAHCISQWGQDFRTSYLDIPAFVEQLGTRPAMAAFTATATPRVREDILAMLGLKSPLTLVTGFDRPNLYFEVKQPNNKYSALTKYVKENSGNGIVYCSTRKEVEAVTEKLIESGYSAARYHAGLSDEERSRSQDDFLYDRVKIIVATNAFGMGIDKSDVRFVIHYNMPQNVESYYQEAGRAGRDGMPADCILFYARKDINTALFLISQSENADEVARNRQLLNQMEGYCETDGCLRCFMLKYFGEEAGADCGNCGNCNGVFVEADVTVDAQKVLSHILRLNKAGKSFMFTHTVDILRGKSEDFTNLSTFGIMKKTSYAGFRRLINRLIALGYIYEDRYLRVTPKADEVLFGGVQVKIRENKSEPTAKEKRLKKLAEKTKYGLNEQLFEKLRELRLQFAQEEGVPAFVVFSDATLADMCQKHPQNEDEMLEVSGVGRVKLERYGERFLELLQKEERGEVWQANQAEFTPDILRARAVVKREALQISRIVDNINLVLLQFGQQKTNGMALNKLLAEAGYLEDLNGTKLPTKRGRELGIKTVERRSNRGNYTQCLFGTEAQRLCIELVLEFMFED